MAERERPVSVVEADPTYCLLGQESFDQREDRLLLKADVCFECAGYVCQYLRVGNPAVSFGPKGTN